MLIIAIVSLLFAFELRANVCFHSLPRTSFSFSALGELFSSIQFKLIARIHFPTLITPFLCAQRSFTSSLLSVVFIRPFFVSSPCSSLANICSSLSSLSLSEHLTWLNNEWRLSTDENSFFRFFDFNFYETICACVSWMEYRRPQRAELKPFLVARMKMSAA